ncbi:DUF397 domain-containing protein [Streptomyces sp. SCA3-4]|uniref:DUF397 domain-containing protein n=1 Tax=Streptomyces sichuanensis TaxID=2871810 RepID=UPI001CE26232|nr:DUF397 domain-containing protein [Streptomyces sichuanensis]MCA6096525.1 DUF397 domain-containing protein [Streptomyces sichuanensis]
MSAMPQYVPSPAGHPGPCDAVWHRSSYSTGMNNCVETASLAPGLLAVRDSKRTSGPVLRFAPTAWSVFVGELGGKSGGKTTGRR